MSIKYWAYVYKLVPRKNIPSEDQFVHDLVLKRVEEKGTTFSNSCCVEGGEWPETPESIVDHLNKQFSTSPAFVLVQKWEITEEEYISQFKFKTQLARENTKHFQMS